MTTHQAEICDLEKTTCGLALERGQRGCSTGVIYLKGLKKQKNHIMF